MIMEIKEQIAGSLKECKTNGEVTTHQVYGIARDGVARMLNRIPPKGGADVLTSIHSKVDQRVRDKLNSRHYAFYFNRVTWQFDGECLTLQGILPTFYLKQILQTLLRDVEDVAYLVNNVDVVNSTGLSSEANCEKVQ